MITAFVKMCMWVGGFHARIQGKNEIDFFYFFPTKQQVNLFIESNLHKRFQYLPCNCAI